MFFSHTWIIACFIISQKTEEQRQPGATIRWRELQGGTLPTPPYPPPPG